MASNTSSTPVYLRLKNLPPEEIPDMLHPFINMIGVKEGQSHLHKPKNVTVYFYTVSYVIVTDDDDNPLTRTFNVRQSLYEVIDETDIPANIQELYNTLSDAEDDEDTGPDTEKPPDTSIVDSVKEIWDLWVSGGKKGPAPQAPPLPEDTPNG